MIARGVRFISMASFELFQWLRSSYQQVTQLQFFFQVSTICLESSCIDEISSHDTQVWHSVRNFVLMHKFLTKQRANLVFHSESGHLKAPEMKRIWWIAHFCTLNFNPRRIAQFRTLNFNPRTSPHHPPNLQHTCVVWDFIWCWCLILYVKRFNSAVSIYLQSRRGIFMLKAFTKVGL